MLTIIKKLTFLVAFIMFLQLFAVSTASAQKSDSERRRLKWDKIAAPSNADGDIEKVYFGYTRPDGKHFNLVAELPYPVASDEFTGGEIRQQDINFDSIPDLMISLVSVNGGMDFIYEGYVWDPVTFQFQLIKHFRDIVNPDIDFLNKRIISLGCHDDVIEAWVFKWKNGRLVKTDYDVTEKEGYKPTAEETRLQNESLAGKWKWVDDDEFSSDIPLILSLSSNHGDLSVNEFTVNDTTVTFGLFDIECSYFNRVLTLKNPPYIKGRVDSCQIYARLQRTPGGDLIGTFSYSVGGQNSQGTVTLRKLEE